MSDINVVSRTQKIIVDAASSSVSVINAGPQGPQGLNGTIPNVIKNYVETAVIDTTITTTEEVQITGGSFTAVSGRYYRVTYYEPNLYAAGGDNFMKLRIRSINLTGTERQMATPGVGATFTGAFVVSRVITGISGTHNFVATAQSNNGTQVIVRATSSPQYAYLLVEDLGTL